jgi:hypothetical protein
VFRTYGTKSVRPTIHRISFVTLKRFNALTRSAIFPVEPDSEQQFVLPPVLD